MLPEDKAPHYLYKVTNKVNGKLYIGVTKNPEVRKNSHLKYNVGSLLNKAVIKYGSENFSFEVLCIGLEDYIYNLEKKAIELYDSSLKGNGYNTMLGGKQGKGNYKKSVDSPYFVSGFWFPNKLTAMNSLSIPVGMFNSRKKNGVLGDTKYEYKKGPQEPVYVSGFWFESKKAALEKLGMSPAVYQGRKNQGVLGELTQPQKRSKKSYYFRGFWFNNLDLASSTMCVSRQQILRLTKSNKIEESEHITSQNYTKKYSVFGVIYKTLDEAATGTKIPLHVLSYNILNNKEGFTYVYSL